MEIYILSGYAIALVIAVIGYAVYQGSLHLKRIERLKEANELEEQAKLEAFKRMHPLPEGFNIEFSKELNAFIPVCKGQAVSTTWLDTYYDAYYCVKNHERRLSDKPVWNYEYPPTYQEFLREKSKGL
jgi:hypothetical protein